MFENPYFDRKYLINKILLRRIKSGNPGCRTLKLSMNQKRIRYILFYLTVKYLCQIFHKLMLESSSLEDTFSPFILQLLNELSRMQLSVSDHQDHSQRLQQELERRLQEKEQTIRAQQEQVSTDSR